MRIGLTLKSPETITSKIYLPGFTDSNTVIVLYPYTVTFKVMEELDISEHSQDQQLFTDKQKELIRVRTSKLINRVVTNNIGVVVFLDRSGRPLEWMLEAGWKIYGNDKPMPIIKYANVGREKQRFDYYAPPEMDGSIENWYLPAAKIKFQKHHADNDYFQKVRSDLNKNGEYSGKILIVDDYQNTGFSVKTARQLFRYYFPKAQVRDYTFFISSDSDIFPKPDTVKDWLGGPFLPWSIEKQVLVKENSDLKSLVTQGQYDAAERQSGLRLKNAIRSIFTSQMSLK